MIGAGVREYKPFTLDIGVVFSCQALSAAITIPIAAVLAAVPTDEPPPEAVTDSR